MTHNLHSFFEKTPLILASASPQRKRILEMMNVPFRVVTSDFEEMVNLHLSPEQNAKDFAEGKTKAVFARLNSKNPLNPLDQGGRMVSVGVDTLVVSEDGEILGKPENEEDAKRMILQKSNTTEQVISGICVMSSEKCLVRYEKAEIVFGHIGDDEAEYMLSCNEWQGRSGSICVEGKSSVFIKEIKGNLWNIVGFPIPTFLQMMEEFLS